MHTQTLGKMLTIIIYNCWMFYFIYNYNLFIIAYMNSPYTGHVEKPRKIERANNTAGT